MSAAPRASSAGATVVTPLADPPAGGDGLVREGPMCGADDPHRFGVRDSNGHERRAHAGLALDSHTRLLATIPSRTGLGPVSVQALEGTLSSRLPTHGFECGSLSVCARRVP
jgi:hypothetical protein